MKFSLEQQVVVEFLYGHLNLGLYPSTAFTSGNKRNVTPQFDFGAITNSKAGVDAGAQLGELQPQWVGAVSWR